MCCYIGKATKIFIFIVTVLVLTGLILGLGGLFRKRNRDRGDHASCSGESCNLTASPAPPNQINPIATFPDPNPSISPPNNGPSSSAPPPPPPPDSVDQSPESPNSAPPPPQLQASAPPPPPPPAVSAIPPELSPPSAALVASGPAHS
ncbi:hypothetical protein DM860_009001 [Cuscuta australis]|uniref:Uncharacterized protein n=1 Tax=Cuscuta australis TaxID=267555 RepID=A0A328DBV8_9ASTE|nr:hypothetical protein DM860_009001 [Cuscuta australis]